MKPQVPEGHYVRYKHSRMKTKSSRFSENERVSSKGGTCVATVYRDSDDKAIVFGVAVCHQNDNYNKRIARDISLGRAIKNMEDMLS